MRIVDASSSHVDPLFEPSTWRPLQHPRDALRFPGCAVGDPALATRFAGDNQIVPSAGRIAGMLPGDNTDDKWRLSGMEYEINMHTLPDRNSFTTPERFLEMIEGYDT